MAKDKEEKREQVEKPEGTEAPKAQKAKPEAKKASAKTQEASSEKKAKGPKKAGAPRSKLLERTYFAKTGEIKPNWKLIDATNIPLGRLSTMVATILMGKDKPTYTRSVEMSDTVVVVNAEKVQLTGNKWEQKEYNYHTEFPGGIKTFTATELRDKWPNRLVEWSVYGMLPKGHMGRKWYKKLFVYKGSEHPHKAQKPQPVQVPGYTAEGRA